MERTADPDGSDVALAESPASWPAPEAEGLYRRPPAEHAVPDPPHRPGVPAHGQHSAAEPPGGRYQDRQAETWEAFAPSRPGHSLESGWETSGEISPPLPAPAHAAPPPAPAFPAAEPAPARTSFGVTGGPISPSGLADLPRPIDTAPVRRRSRLASAAVGLLAVLIVLAGVAGGVVFFSESGRAVVSSWLGGADPATAPAAVPVDGRTTATFVLAAAARTVSVRAADLGADLFRITGAPAPAVKGDRVELSVTGDAERVEVQLSSKVTWMLRLTGGSAKQVVDLTGGRVGGLDLSGSSDRTELVLPRPAGTVALKVTGAVGDLTVTVPAAHPVRVTLDSGAATVTAGARTLRDVEPGATLTPRNWKTGDRYDLGAAARLGTLTIRNAG